MYRPRVIYRRLILIPVFHSVLPVTHQSVDHSHYFNPHPDSPCGPDGISHSVTDPETGERERGVKRVKDRELWVNDYPLAAVSDSGLLI